MKVREVVPQFDELNWMYHYDWDYICFSKISPTGGYIFPHIPTFAVGFWIKHAFGVSKITLQLEPNSRFNWNYVPSVLVYPFCDYSHLSYNRYTLQITGDVKVTLACQTCSGLPMCCSAYQHIELFLSSGESSVPLITQPVKSSAEVWIDFVQPNYNKHRFDDNWICQVGDHEKHGILKWDNLVFHVNNSDQLIMFRIAHGKTAEFLVKLITERVT